jgi:hypothetical protein
VLWRQALKWRGDPCPHSVLASPLATAGWLKAKKLAEKGMPQCVLIWMESLKLAAGLVFIAYPSTSSGCIYHSVSQYLLRESLFKVTL